MKKIVQVGLLLFFLGIISSCNGSGTTLISSAAIGDNGDDSQVTPTEPEPEPDPEPDPTPTPTPTPEPEIFAGITSISGKTDSTVTLNWTASTDAANYHLYDMTSGIPIYKQLIADPTTNSLSLSNLTPGTTYKFRLRMMHLQGTTDNNTHDATVEMNTAPDKTLTPVLLSPAAMPYIEPQPTFTVGGIKNGDTIKLFNDNACGNQVGELAVSTPNATSANIQVASPLAEGTYEFTAASANSLGNLSVCSDPVSYSFTIPVYNPTLTATSTPLVGITDMTLERDSNWDDGSIEINLPFAFFISNTAFTKWFVGTNTYLTAGTGSGAYSSLSGSTPAIPKFFLGSADNSIQRMYVKSGNNYFRVRYEGNGTTSGTPGSPGITFEFTFFKPTTDKQYIQVVFGGHNRFNGAFGIASASAYYTTLPEITQNSSYVFESDLQGENWTIHPNSHITGNGISE